MNTTQPMSGTVDKETTQPIAAYDEFIAQLAELREYNATVVFDYEDPKGNKEARSHVYQLRQTKAAVDRKRKKEKEASLEYGRQVDAQARSITGELDEMIDVHLNPLKRIEAREEARIAEIQARLAAFNVIEPSSDTPSEDFALWLNTVKLIPLDETWQEFLAEAGVAKDSAINVLQRHYESAMKREAEAAELKRLRDEQEARRKQDEANAIAQAAAEQAQRDAESKAAAELATLQQAKDDAEKHHQAQLRKQKEQAERRELELKLSAEQAEKARLAEKEAAERNAREQVEAQVRRDRDREHRRKVNQRAVANLVYHAKIPSDLAKQVIQSIVAGKIPNVTLTY